MQKNVAHVCELFCFDITLLVAVNVCITALEAGPPLENWRWAAGDLFLIVSSFSASTWAWRISIISIYSPIATKQDNMTRCDSNSTYLQDGKPQKPFQRFFGRQCCTKRKMSKTQERKKSLCSLQISRQRYINRKGDTVSTIWNFTQEPLLVTWLKHGGSLSR